MRADVFICLARSGLGAEGDAVMASELIISMCCNPSASRGEGGSVLWSHFQLEASAAYSYIPSPFVKVPTVCWAQYQVPEM